LYRSRNSSFGDIEAQLQQFPMNPRHTPGWILSPPSGRSGPEAPCVAAFFQELSDAENASANRAESRLDASRPRSQA
jgi:hypothetical protein